MAKGDIPHLQEKVLAGRLLTAGASKTSAALDSFASWLLGGFAAAFALILSSDSTIGRYIFEEDLKFAGSIFLWAAGITIIEKYLSAIIRGAAEVAAQAEDAVLKLAADGVELNFAIVFQEVQSAVVRPARWIVARSQAKLIGGDFAVSGRNLFRCAQAQGLLVLVSAALLLAALSILLRGLGG